MDPGLAFHLDGDTLSNSRTFRSVQECASFDWHQSLQIEKGQGRSPDGLLNHGEAKLLKLRIHRIFHRDAFCNAIESRSPRNTS
jgi:hypothetical protein